MALNAYTGLDGQKQGNVKGSVTQDKAAETAPEEEAAAEVISPRDAASGLPTGKRMHKPY